jgi:aerobic carbon-monoxide dehydrogenase medium subunit
MYPGKFDYAAPASFDEVLSALAARGEEAKVMAGGQSLIPLLKLRFAAPTLVIDINRLADLEGLDETPDHLRIGALTRHNALANSDLLKTSYPLMATAAPLISDPLVRNLGTIGGSLAHADPAGDWGSVMLALNAEVVARSEKSERTVPVTELFNGAFTTSMEPNELLTEIRVPRSPRSSGGTYLKLERKVGDFATVGTAVQVEMDDGVIGRAGIGLTAVGSQNIRAAEAEDALSGVEPNPDAFRRAGALAAAAAAPVSDVRGSADYKRAVVKAFVERGLAQAVDRARKR